MIFLDELRDDPVTNLNLFMSLKNSRGKSDMAYATSWTVEAFSIIKSRFRAWPEPVLRTPHVHPSLHIGMHLTNKSLYALRSLLIRCEALDETIDSQMTRCKWERVDELFLDTQGGNGGRFREGNARQLSRCILGHDGQ